LWTGPIVDAHQHFWDPFANDHPWLRPDVIIPFRYGDYSAIKRRYLPADYLADAVGHRISETAYVGFGAQRAMFASNFPVDGLCGSFDTIYSGFKRIAARYSQADQAHLFCETGPERLPHHGALSFRCRRLMVFNLLDPEEVEMIASR
jgi:predicted TIM-barrel fold metal-dependent hydrolase